MKANSNQAVLRTLARLGAGMDVVSEGELRRARAAGVPARRSSFSGVGKTASEIAHGLDEAFSASTSSPSPSWRCSSAVAAAAGPDRAHRAARQPGRRRQDPPQDLDRQVGEQVRHPDRPRPGGLCARRRGCRASEVTGVDMHIGSQITDLQPFDDAFALLCRLRPRAAQRTGIAIDHLDLGGGLGIPYREETSRRPIPSLTPRS